MQNGGSQAARWFTSAVANRKVAEGASRAGPLSMLPTLSTVESAADSSDRLADPPEQQRWMIAPSSNLTIIFPLPTATFSALLVQLPKDVCL